MKQLHNDLPDWALWLAQDADGAWWCYEAEPNQHGTGWYENEAGRLAKVGHGEPNSAWRESLVVVASR
ncbi:MAG: hypothetical protein PHX10_12425 [Gallionellaceae bacterium]|nr:hypothetical protein [Gallionellaceae bacterium]